MKTSLKFEAYKNIKSFDTHKLYPIVIFAIDEENNNGYACDPDEEFGIKTIPYNKTIGFLRVLPNNDGTFFAAKVFVLRNYRNQGVASKMYDMAKGLTHNKMVPSIEQSEDGKAFTKKYFKTFEQFRAEQKAVLETLEPNHDLSELEFAAFSEDEVVEDELEEDGEGAPTNNMGSGNIPGANIPAGSHFGEPGVPVRKKFQLMNGPPVDPRMFSGKIFDRKPPVKLK
jgi:Acetyltransferase (GNAT) family